MNCIWCFICLSKEQFFFITEFILTCFTKYFTCLAPAFKRGFTDWNYVHIALCWCPYSYKSPFTPRITIYNKTASTLTHNNILLTVFMSSAALNVQVLFSHTFLSFISSWKNKQTKNIDKSQTVFPVIKSLCVIFLCGLYCF